MSAPFPVTWEPWEMAWGGWGGLRFGMLTAPDGPPLLVIVAGTPLVVGVRLYREGRTLREHGAVWRTMVDGTPVHPPELWRRVEAEVQDRAAMALARLDGTRPGPAGGG